MKPKNKEINLICRTVHFQVGNTMQTVASAVSTITVYMDTDKSNLPVFYGKTNLIYLGRWGRYFRRKWCSSSSIRRGNAFHPSSQIFVYNFKNWLMQRVLMWTSRRWLYLSFPILSQILKKKIFYENKLYPESICTLHLLQLALKICNRKSCASHIKSTMKIFTPCMNSLIQF